MCCVRRFFLLGFVCLAAHGFGQTAPAAQASPAATPSSSPAQVVMPTDPVALLELAAKKNGLQNAGSAPWHLKATYQVLDDTGAVKETGIFEEFWVSNKKYRKSYAGPSLTQTDYATGNGWLRIGDLGWPEGPTALVQGVFLPWFPPDHDMSAVKLKLADQNVFGLPMR